MAASFSFHPEWSQRPLDCPKGKITFSTHHPCVVVQWAGKRAPSSQRRFSLSSRKGQLSK